MNETTTTKAKGKKAEDQACSFLVKKGFEIIERNYRYGHGEIDIIAKSPDNNLVFVEVKSRGYNDTYQPEDSISITKRKQIRKIASAYLWEKGIDNIDCRIDVVTIIFTKGQAPQIKHFVDAF